MTLSDDGVHGVVDDAVEPIAIIGMACRFPGDVSSSSEFWAMLAQARSGLSAVPADRFETQAWRHPNHERKGTVSGLFSIA